MSSCLVFNSINIEWAQDGLLFLNWKNIRLKENDDFNLFVSSSIKLSHELCDKPIQLQNEHLIWLEYIRFFGSISNQPGTCSFRIFSISDRCLPVFICKGPCMASYQCGLFSLPIAVYVLRKNRWTQFTVRSFMIPSQPHSFAEKVINFAQGLSMCSSTEGASCAIVFIPYLPILSF